MRIIKDIQRSYLLTAIVYIIIGVVLALWPSITTTTLCYLFSLVIAFLGIYHLISYLKAGYSLEEKNNGLIHGIFAISFSIFTILRPEMIMAMIPILIGFSILWNGIVKLQYALDAYHLKYHGWWRILFLALINISFGVVLLSGVLEQGSSFVMLLGLGAVYSGVTDLINIYWLSEKYQAIQQEKGKEEVEEGIISEKK